MASQTNLPSSRPACKHFINIGVVLLSTSLFCYAIAEEIDHTYISNHATTDDPEETNEKDRSLEANGNWVIAGVSFGIGFMCVILLSYAYRKKIKFYFKKCFGKKRRLDPEQIDAEHLSSLDSLILSSKLKNPDGYVDDGFNSPDLDDFADLMAESFTKKTTERQEMERRFGQPLL